MARKVLIVDTENRGGDFAGIAHDSALQASLNPQQFDKAAEAYGHLSEAGVVVVAALIEPRVDRTKANSPWNLLRKAHERGLPWAAVLDTASYTTWLPSPDGRHMVTPPQPEEMKAAFSTWFADLGVVVGPVVLHNHQIAAGDEVR